MFASLKYSIIVGAFALSAAFGQVVPPCSSFIQTGCRKMDGTVIPKLPAAVAPLAAPTIPEPVIPTTPVAASQLCNAARTFTYPSTPYAVPFVVDITNVPAVPPYPFAQVAGPAGSGNAANQQCWLDYMTLTLYIMPYVNAYASAYPAWWAANQATYLTKAAQYSGDHFVFNGVTY